MCAHKMAGGRLFRIRSSRVGLSHAEEDPRAEEGVSSLPPSALKPHTQILPFSSVKKALLLLTALHLGSSLLWTLERERDRMREREREKLYFDNCHIRLQGNKRRFPINYYAKKREKKGGG